MVRNIVSHSTYPTDNISQTRAGQLLERIDLPPLPPMCTHANLCSHAGMSARPHPHIQLAARAHPFCPAPLTPACVPISTTKPAHTQNPRSDPLFAIPRTCASTERLSVTAPHARRSVLRDASHLGGRYDPKCLASRAEASPIAMPHTSPHVHTRLPCPMALPARSVAAHQPALRSFPSCALTPQHTRQIRSSPYAHALTQPRPPSSSSGFFPSSSHTRTALCAPSHQYLNRPSAHRRRVDSAAQTGSDLCGRQEPRTTASTSHPALRAAGASSRSPS